MKVVEEIKKPIFKEMELFEKKFYKSMSSNVSLLNRITNFIVRRKGKQMRPMFVFLCAKLVSDGKVNAALKGNLSPDTITLDEAVELINNRRQNPPKKRKKKNKK